MREASILYWKEGIESGADDLGLKLTQQQLNYLAETIQGGFENYDTAFGYDVISVPAESQAKEELRNLKAEIKKREDWELSTEPCETCTTRGTVEDVYGRTICCDYCGGKGRR